MKQALRKYAFPAFLVMGMAITIFAIKSGAPWTATLLFLFLATVMFNLAVEYWIPYRAFDRKRPYARDLSFTFFNIFVTSKVGEMVMIALVALITQRLLGSQTVFASDDLGPLWMQVIGVILVTDFIRYWMHFAQHKVPFLWKFHAVHHSVEEIYSLNTFVSHPFDFFLRNSTAVPIVVGLGFHPGAVLIAVPFASIGAIFSHSRADFDFGWLNYVFSTNRLHRWHHSRLPEESDRNFGVALIIWDLVFGTFYLPADRPHPEALGLKPTHPHVPRRFWTVLAYPFLKRA